MSATSTKTTGGQAAIAELRERQPTRRWRAWRFPNSNWSLHGYSRSADKTFLYIPELGIGLDAGQCRGKRTENLFITHTHADHATDATYMCLRPGGVDCYLPASAVPAVEAYIRAGVELNNNAAFDPTMTEYTLHGMRDGDVISGLRGKRKDFRVRVFDCQHCVPCVGFAFAQARKKLKEQYRELSGQEIGKLRRVGTEISEEVIVPQFVYVGDTNVSVFEKNPWLFDYPVIITECTFLYETDEIGVAARCARDGHTCWELGLEEVVLAHPEVTFVLIHFSLRYGEEEIFEYFRKRSASGLDLTNVVIFVGDMQDA